MRAQPPARPARAWRRRLAVAAFVAAIALALAAAIAGGLLRAGVRVPLPAGAVWPAHAVPGHAFLMMVSFMGTVIGLERAVATKRPWAWGAPVLAAASGPALLAGAMASAAWLAVAAALVFVAVNVHVFDRQRAVHTGLLLTGAAAWLAGNLLTALGVPTEAVLPWWFAFLVLTIAAERLEMTRLMRRRRGATAALLCILAAMLAGALAGVVDRLPGGLLFGASLIALAAWLAVFDIARRTLCTQGLSRYMAVCLLTGYAWLALAGLAWAAMAMGIPTRDAALHALGLGFVFSMMLGHAPVILPALARIKVLFGWPFYLPFALLHGSLAWRLLAGWLDAAWLGAGALGNALAIGAFAATMLGAAQAWRMRHDPLRNRHHAIPSRH